MSPDRDTAAELDVDGAFQHIAAAAGTVAVEQTVGKTLAESADAPLHFAQRNHPAAAGTLAVVAGTLVAAAGPLAVVAGTLVAAAGPLVAAAGDQTHWVPSRHY